MISLDRILVGLGRRIVCRSELFCESITDRFAWFLLALLVYNNPSEQERRSDEGGARSPATIGRYVSPLSTAKSYKNSIEFEIMISSKSFLSLKSNIFRSYCRGDTMPEA